MPDQELKVGDYFAFQPSSVGIITEQYSLNGKTISHVQFPDEFIWLYTESVGEINLWVNVSSGYPRTICLN